MNKDQRLIAEAYEAVCNREISEKINWKGAAAAGILGASALLGNTAKAADTGDFVQQRTDQIFANMPDSKGSSYIDGIEIYDYYNVLLNLTPQEKAKVNAAFKSLGQQAGMDVLNNVVASKVK